MTTENDAPEESTWMVRDPESGEVEELAKQAGDVPEHEPGDDDWDKDAEGAS